jgi:signal transduction histidine kinase
MVDQATPLQDELPDIIFNQSPMGLARVDHTLTLCRFNPTWAALVSQLSPTQPNPIKIGSKLLSIMPYAEETLLPLFEQVIADKRSSKGTVRLSNYGITCHWEIVLIPYVDQSGSLTVVFGVIDITERVLAQQELERRVDARSRELQALLAVYRQVVSLDTEPLLDLTLKQLQLVVDYTSAAIMTLDTDELVVQAFRGTGSHQPPPKLRIQLNTIAVAEEIVRTRQPVTIVDIREKSDRVSNFSQQMERYFSDIYQYTWAWMGIPLIIRGEVIGILNLFHNQPNYYMPYHADLALAFAHHVTVAIESDRHYHQVRELATLTERDRLARSLHDRLAQALGYINIKASLIDQLLQTQQIVPAQESLQELKTVVSNTYADVREAIFNLRTKVYGGADFLPMLRDYLAEYETQYNIKTRVSVQNEAVAVFPDQVGTQVIRVIQEALSNVRKHASASHVDIIFSEIGRKSAWKFVTMATGLIPLRLPKNIGAVLDLTLCGSVLRVWVGLCK